MTPPLPTLADIRAAHDRIRGHVHRTPVLTCSAIDALAGARLFFKCENFQKVGAFKARGAANAVLSLDAADAARGVVTHSSGNHAAALALAARARRVPAWVVMPRTAPAPKKAAVAGYGATIVECEPTLAAREANAARIVAETGAAFIHPFDDPRVIAGQGTAAVELLEDAGVDLDVVTCPVGGGGLLAGTAIASKALGVERVVAAEPAAADDAYRSWTSGVLQTAPERPATIADGLLTSLSPLTFAALRAHVDAVATVDDEAIVRAMRLVWERMKIIIEPSCAVPLAAILERRWDARGLAVGVILTGGNVDLDRLPWIVRG